jgi:hypothetical protein
MKFIVFIFPAFFISLLIIPSGCAYRWGAPDRSLPGGYRLVFIPIFKNLTAEPGIEVEFTNALRREFERSKVAHVAEPELAEAELVGEIISLGYQPEAPKEGGDITTGTVLVTQYNIVLNVRITLKKRANQAVLWAGDFSSQRTYIAPQVNAAGINTVNPLYNLSARRQNIQVMSATMMAEAHDRITENF